MANYNSDKVVPNPATGVNTIEPKYNATGSIPVLATMTFYYPNLQVGDTVQLMDLPANVRLTGAAIDCSKLDGGTTPTLVFNVGDSVFGANSIMTGVTIGENAGYGGLTQQGVLGRTYTQTTRVFLTVTTRDAASYAGFASIVFRIDYAADA